MSQKAAKAAKIGASSVIVVLALGGLLYTTLGESMEYYKSVDEVLADPDAWRDRNLTLYGHAHAIARIEGTLRYRFEIHNNGEVITAFYTGKVPDTFLDEAEVTAKGRLQPDGTFLVQSDGIVAKCPSKYEEQQRPIGSPASVSTAGTY